MNKPNIILIVSDQHRGDFMGCAGSPVVSTPNLDQLAHDGVMFTQAYCSSPLCVPSRMSMLTGRHPHRTGVFDNGDCLPSDMPTFAHALALGGYETVLCGRMHFVGPDQRHGFMHRLVGDITPSYTGGPKTKYGPLAGTSDSAFLSIEMAGQGPNPVLGYDETVTAACGQYLLECSRRGRTAPLFLTVGLYGPHNPYTCPEEEYNRATAAMEHHDDAVIPMDAGMHPWEKQTIADSGLDRITAEQTRKTRANYIGLVNQLDRYIGRIVTAARQLREDTIVIYLSDHGDMAGDHGLFWKRSFYEGAAKVPMICCPVVQASGPCGWAQGIQIDAPVSLVDLAPTLAGLTRSPELPGQDGADLTPLLLQSLSSGGLEAWRDRPVFSELMTSAKSPARMIRHRQFKLVHYDGYPDVRLFDLEKDPCELKDLSEDTSYAEIRGQLIERLLEGWDAGQLIERRDARRPDLDYMKLWGSRVGMGKLDLWDH